MRGVFDSTKTFVRELMLQFQIGPDETADARAAYITFSDEAQVQNKAHQPHTNPGPLSNP